MTCFHKLRLLLGLVLAVVLTGCATISFDQPKPYSQAITSFENTALGEYAASKVEAQEGLSGFYPLKEGMDALGIRLRLAEMAEKSLDLQYFLMKDDTAGAAVANRRMHNKSFTADNVISVVGGRNIADEYFQLKTDIVFVDFDVLALGPIVTEISHSFDAYWNHSRAVPIEQFIKDPKKESLETVSQEIAEELDEIYDSIYEKALRSNLLRDLINDRQQIFAAPAHVIADSPDKLINEVNETHMRLARELGEIIQNAEKEAMFISPYYVPGDTGVQMIKDLVQKGVRVLVVTNSLASNNHVPVHAAYARYRRDVIQAGAELYEIRANAARDLSDTREGPDKLTLHTKAIYFDSNKIFVGSLNLDPRSIDLNAEMGLLIESKAMVEMLLENRDKNLATNAYRVLVDDNGDLEWHCTIENQNVIETKEPLTSRWLRFKAWFMKIAPESQL